MPTSADPAGLSPSKLAIMAFYAGVFLAPFASLRIPGMYLTASDLLLILAGVLIFPNAVKSRRWNKVKAAWACAFWLLCAGYLISGLLGGQGPVLETLSTIIQLGFVLLYLPWILTQFTKSSLLHVVAIFVVGIVSSILLALALQNFLPNAYTSLVQLNIMVTTGERFGAFMGTNSIAKMAALAVPLVFLLYAYGKIRYGTSVLILVILAWGLVLTASNGGTIAFLIAVLASVLLAPGRERLRAALVILGAVLPVWIAVRIVDIDFSVFSQRVLEALFVGDISEAGSFSLKVSIMEAAWQAIVAQPFYGWGAGEFARAGGFDTTVHNSYLLVWVEGGVLAVAGLVVLLLSAVAVATGRVSSHSRKANRLAIVFVVVFCVNLLTSTDVYQRFQMIPLLLIVLSVVQLSQCSSVSDDQSAVAAEQN